MQQGNGGRMLPEVIAMKIKNKIIGKLAIIRTATNCEMPTADVCSNIQEAIDAAWATDDLSAKKAREALFPQGKPTPEEFVAVLANHAKY